MKDLEVLAGILLACVAVGIVLRVVAAVWGWIAVRRIDSEYRHLAEEGRKLREKGEI